MQGERDSWETGAPDDQAPFEVEIKQWLARELHDTVSATLTTMLIQMEQLKRREDDQVGVRSELEAFQDSTRQVLSNLRRLLYELREEPSLTMTTDLAESLRGMLERFEQRTGISTRLVSSDGWPAQIGSRAGHNLLRIVEEALHNVRSHSGAHSVEVSLDCAGDIAIVTISDDGVGLEDVAEEGGGLGLTGMLERAVLVGGDLRVQSSAGRGTTIQAIFPVERLL
jgi:signal transduction histidine kinase